MSIASDEIFLSAFEDDSPVHAGQLAGGDPVLALLVSWQEEPVPSLVNTDTARAVIAEAKRDKRARAVEEFLIRVAKWLFIACLLRHRDQRGVVMGLMRWLRGKRVSGKDMQTLEREIADVLRDEARKRKGDK